MYKYSIFLKYVTYYSRNVRVSKVQNIMLGLAILNDSICSGYPLPICFANDDCLPQRVGGF